MRKRFGSILDHLREGFQVVDADWRYVYLNDAVCQQARRPRGELLGRPMMECFPGIEDTPMFALLRKCMAERVAGEMENEFTFPDGSVGFFELRFEPVPEGILILSLDIGRRRSLENQLRQSQRLEALGRLAGGIAHDFNNILGAVTGFAEFALDALRPADPGCHEVEQILEAAERAKLLVRQLLAFSMKQTIEPRVVDLNALVHGLEEMLRRILGEDIDFVIRPGWGLWAARIDPSAFEQVLVNLVVNSRDAMPRGGKLTLETFNSVLDQDHEMAQAGCVTPGEYVGLAVTDNGSGMNADTKARLFEPFFTTKPRERGTGLGLATCYGIVTQAEGYIWVYSEPGQGTTVKVYLPRVKAVPEPVATRPLPLALTGTETVLVVEDDPTLLALTARSLQRFGYRVLGAGNAGEAMLQCERAPEPVHLLLTDVVMPRLNGRELALRLSQVYPAMKVLYMTGYTENAIVHHGVLEPGIHLLQKPFTSEALARKVREVLDG